MKFAQKLRQRRLELRLTQKDIADIWGIKSVNVSDWENGKGMPEASKIPALAKRLGISISELMGEKEATNVTPGPDFKTSRQYPVISLVQAGEWTELCDNFAPGDAAEWRPCHRDLGKCGYIVRVKGKSMTAPEGEPYTFPEGILLYVNPDQEPLPGKFVIVRRTRTLEATFKKLILVDGEPFLEAINPNWPNRYLKLQEGDQFCGVVMHAGFDMP